MLMIRRAAALAIVLPIFASAQTSPATPAAAAAQVEPTPPPSAPDSYAPPAAAPAAPAAPAATPAQAGPPTSGKPGVTVDWSGWFQTHAWRTFGGVNSTATGSTDLPTYAVNAHDTAGLSARQSRIRAAVGMPADGLLEGAKLRGLVEVDFMGPLGSDDPSLPAVRLRHAYLAASWRNFGLTVGQTWGLFTGPYFATSLAHLAVPRFGGAGFLYRRAPQIRVSAETSGPLVLSVQLAALAPYDKAKSQNQLVGERSGVPDGEGRVSLAYRTGGRTWVDVGASGHYGRETWFLDGAAQDKTIESWGGSVDARIDVPYLTVSGAAFVGQALGVYATVAPEVRFTSDSTGKTTDVNPVRTMGFWAQAVLTPVAPLQLVAGYGIEEPKLEDLPVGPTPATIINRNQQVSGGAIVALTKAWRVSLEGTWFVTNTQDQFQRNSTQLEVGSLYEF
jgi:hypothetical protein